MLRGRFGNWAGCNSSGRQSPMQNPTLHNPTASSGIRVAIIEDRTEVREGLRQILNGADGFACTGTYSTMEMALAQLPLLRPPREEALDYLFFSLMSALKPLSLICAPPLP